MSTANAEAPQAQPAATAAEPSHVPTSSGDEYTASLLKGIKDAGLANSHMPAGTRYYGGKKDAPASQDSGEVESVEEAKTAPAKPAKPAETAPATPSSQSSLSAGFAKLNRQQRAVQTREAALATREQSVKAIEAEIASRRDSSEKELTTKGADLERMLKLLDEDDGPAFVEALAQKKGVKYGDIYNKLTQRALADINKDPAVDKLQEELKATRAEIAAHKAELEKREAEGRAQAEAAEAQAKQERIAEEQRQHFVTMVTGEWKEQYPLLAQEEPSELKKVAWDLAMDHIKRTGSAPQFAEVAKHLESQLRFAQWEEEQVAVKAAPKAPDGKRAAKAAPIDDTDDEDSGAPVRPAAKSPERPRKQAPSPAPTLTNQLASMRSGKFSTPPKDDNERLERALAEWK